MTGNSLEIEIENGAPVTVDLSSLVNDADFDITNEIQDLSLTGDILTITNNAGATDIDLSAYTNTDNQQISIDGSNVLTLANGTGADTTVDLSGLLNTDEQDLTAATLTGNSLEIEIENGAPVTVDLSSLVNDADFDITNEIQDLSLTGDILTITNNAGATDIDLSAYTNTDNQQISIDGANVLTLANGTGADTTVDLSGLLNTDEQDLTAATLTGNSLEIEIENGAPVTVDLSSLVNDADFDITNEIQDLSLTGDILTITNNAGATDIDLSAYTNTDNQQISIDGANVLTLANGTGADTTVDLSGLLNTDEQDLTAATLTGNSLEIEIENGAPVTVDLSSLVNDADFDITNEIQDLSLTGDILTITNNAGATDIDLSAYTNTDNQQISIDGANVLTLANGTGADTTVDLSGLLNTDEQDLTAATLTGNSLEIEIENGAPVTVDLSSLVNDADFDITNEIQDLSLTGDILTITNNAGATDIDLSAYTNTDNQQISIDGSNVLTLANGTGADTTVDLSGLLNTDEQDLTAATLTGNSLEIEIENGAPVTVDLSSLVNDADFDITNEIQTVASGDGSVGVVRTGDDFDLSVTLPANNDNDPTNELQTLSQAGTDVTLSDGGGTISVADNDNDSTNEIQTVASGDGSVGVVRTAR